MPTDILANIQTIRERIAAAARRIHRSADAVKLLAVTKTVPPAAIRTAMEAGITDFGENYVQEAREKIAAIEQNARWHMIGHLQTNKAKYAVNLFDYIHSVDRLELAAELNKRLEKAGRKMNILIEVNVSGEETKNGVPADRAMDLVKSIAPLKHLSVKGLMTMAPYSDNPENARPCFAALKNLQQDIIREGIDGIAMEELSMGMTDDFEIAIEEGATIVRIGRAIFGERNY
ncbi:MAG TPA: YggS family pyridoxal phosphate-dependent enzyme [Smithella sp.]|nr:YggS family pyridoxal phosphate-dependent enzyme [Smithella sp.]HRS97423.1 YggS family pyridoxal phosphate-dependent enzyme [Smithella sp.]